MKKNEQSVMNMTAMNISKDEFHERTDLLQRHIQQENLAGIILFDRDYILYYTGFSFIPTERPIAFLMNQTGVKILFVPRLELEHALINAIVDRVDYYNEFPSDPHPMDVLKDILVEWGMEDNNAVDQDGYPWIFGYRGPKLSEVVGGSVIPFAAFIENQMMIKSDAELDLIRESVKWGHLAHTLLHRYTKVGQTETEVSLRASKEATLIMLDTIGPIYKAQSPFSRGASAGYRGQIGRNAAIPHALASNLTFRAGDVLVTGANAPVWGYNSELERTMIIGIPSDQQKHMFDHLLALQDIALSTIRPGKLCSDVDREVRAYYENHDLTSYWRHHTGHAIGIRYHEGPFLDLGDQTEIRPGMVFTVEPGLYIPDIGGFRHSDTVAVTDDGIEIMTYYPRELGSLSIPI